MASEFSQVVLPGTLVTGEWLEAKLGSAGLTVVDIRGYVKSSPVEGGQPGHERALYIGAPEEYTAGHIPGAVFIDWTRDIVNPDDPVPAQIAEPSGFAAAMSERGIGDDTAVVIVDHTGGHLAGRLWWALKYYGHDNCALLDGGWNRWVAEGRPVTTGVTHSEPLQFTPRPRAELRSTAEDVLATIETGEALIVDARDAITYRGETWRGRRKGHIKSAVNLPTKSLVNADGTWKSDEELAELVAAAGITPETPVIAYCNGGVTATGVLFALDRLGFRNWSNYDGSWNEWGEREDLPIE